MKTKTKEAAPDLLSKVEPTPAAPVNQYRGCARTAPAKLPVKRKESTAVAKVERNGPLADEASDEVATYLRVISDPSCDVAKAERIEAMIIRAKARVAEARFNEDFIGLQAELPVINKDGLIEAEGTSRAGRAYKQKTHYATYPNIQIATREILHRHRFTLKHTVRPGPGNIGIVVYSTLFHAGHTEIAELPLMLEDGGSKNKVQGVNSSISYGKRINTTTLLDLISRAPEDDDRDGFAKTKRGATAKAEDAAEHDDGKIGSEQVQTLTAKIAECGLTDKRFCNNYKIERIVDLPAARYNEAIEACDNFKKQQVQK